MPGAQGADQPISGRIAASNGHTGKNTVKLASEHKKLQNFGDKGQYRPFSPSYKRGNLYTPLFHAPVAQLDRVTGFEPVGREFESLRAHQLPSKNPSKK